MPKHLIWIKSLTLLSLLGLAASACANDTPLTYDRINFQIEASRQVENDTLIANLYFQKEGENAQKLAAEVNRNIAWGLEQARKLNAIKVQTLDYYTNPRYRNQKLLGWRVSQSIRLESRNSALLSRLIGNLQQRLSVRSIGYDVSPTRRLQVQDELIEEAIQGFQKRAQAITEQLGRSEYRLVEMNVNTSSSSIRPPQRRVMAMKAEADIAPPSLEAGTQKLSISVTGTIELKLD